MIFHLYCQRLYHHVRNIGKTVQRIYMLILSFLEEAHKFELIRVETGNCFDCPVTCRLPCPPKECDLWWSWTLIKSLFPLPNKLLTRNWMLATIFGCQAPAIHKKQVWILYCHLWFPGLSHGLLIFLVTGCCWSIPLKFNWTCTSLQRWCWFKQRACVQYTTDRGQVCRHASIPVGQGPCM